MYSNDHHFSSSNDSDNSFDNWTPSSNDSFDDSTSSSNNSFDNDEIFLNFNNDSDNSSVDDDGTHNVTRKKLLEDINLYNLCESYLMKILYPQDIDKLGLPKLIQENFLKNKLFLLKGIKKLRIVYKLEINRITAFEKISLDLRNQLWNSMFLMELWYEKDDYKYDEAKVYEHVTLGNICMNCIEEEQEEDQWFEYTIKNSMSDIRFKICRGEQFWCSKCLLTPLVTYDNINNVM